jgi:septal ring factor EnvC (AmiA/AmiB activator)
MAFLINLRAGALAAVVAVCALPAAAQDTGALTTTDDVRSEISQAMEAIAAYSEQERDQALAEARAALTRLDAEIERREEAIRQNWAEMSDATRDSARARLRDLREARNRLSERYGALETGASGAWDELKTGFSNAWGAFSDAWSAADEDEPVN